MADCRARNPLTCRTHGTRIRQDVAAVHRVFGDRRPFDQLSRDAAGELATNALRLNASSVAAVEQVLNGLWRTRVAGASIRLGEVRDAFDDALVQARFDLHRGPVDFTSYPLASLRNEHRGSQGYMDRRVWLRDHGVPDEAPDTVFGTPYIYCGAHVRPHEAGWCTVSIADKGPLSAPDREGAYAETRALGFRIYGED